nr:thioredoxin family protein [Candidatus Sigynarchaeota archaeon]
MPEPAKIHGAQEFDKAKGSAKVVLIDFTATWCGPCRMLGPILEQLATEYKPEDMKLFKLDVDENNDLSNKFHISAVPAVAFFKNGQQQGQLLVGLRKKDDYKKMIDAFLK